MIGAFLWGKLPAHGDFVARGLAPTVRDDLDRWLAASLATARLGLGDAFDDVYDQAPPWRFAWRDGTYWTAGAMAPSVDGVGRRYPILLALAGIAADQVEGAGEAMENLLYDALASGWDADRLHTAVPPVPTASTPWTAGEGWWTLGAEHFNDAWLAGARPPSLMATMLTRVTPATAGAEERERA